MLRGQAPVKQGQAPEADNRIVTPKATLQTMELPLLHGRNFSDADGAGGQQVAMINQTMAREYFNSKDPVGEELNLGTADKPDWWQIVGVTGDVKAFGQDQLTHADIYRPFAQLPFPLIAFTLRTNTDPGFDGEDCRRSDVERRSKSSSSQSKSDGFARQPNPGRAPREFGTDLLFRGVGIGSGLHRNLRGDDLRGRTAQSRDWRADGAWSTARTGCAG